MKAGRGRAEFGLGRADVSAASLNRNAGAETFVVLRLSFTKIFATALIILSLAADEIAGFTRCRRIPDRNCRVALAVRFVSVKLLRHCKTKHFHFVDGRVVSHALVLPGLERVDFDVARVNLRKRNRHHTLMREIGYFTGLPPSDSVFRSVHLKTADKIQILGPAGIHPHFRNRLNPPEINLDKFRVRKSFGLIFGIPGTAAIVEAVNEPGGRINSPVERFAGRDGGGGRQIPAQIRAPALARFAALRIEPRLPEKSELVSFHFHKRIVRRVSRIDGAPALRPENPPPPSVKTLAHRLGRLGSKSLFFAAFQDIAFFIERVTENNFVSILIFHLKEPAVAVKKPDRLALELGGTLARTHEIAQRIFFVAGIDPGVVAINHRRKVSKDRHPAGDGRLARAVFFGAREGVGVLAIDSPVARKIKTLETVLVRSSVSSRKRGQIPVVDLTVAGEIIAEFYNLVGGRDVSQGVLVVGVRGRESIFIRDREGLSQRRKLLYGHNRRLPRPADSPIFFRHHRRISVSVFGILKSDDPAVFVTRINLLALAVETKRFLPADSLTFFGNIVHALPGFTHPSDRVVTKNDSRLAAVLVPSQDHAAVTILPLGFTEINRVSERVLKTRAPRDLLLPPRILARRKIRDHAISIRDLHNLAREIQLADFKRPRAGRIVGIKRALPHAQGISQTVFFIDEFLDKAAREFLAGDFTLAIKNLLCDRAVPRVGGQAFRGNTKTISVVRKRARQGRRFDLLNEFSIRIVTAHGLGRHEIRGSRNLSDTDEKFRDGRLPVLIRLRSFLRRELFIITSPGLEQSLR